MNMFLALQAHWRGYNAFSYYRKLQCAAISFQCAMRSHIARRELKLLQRVCLSSSFQLLCFGSPSTGLTITLHCLESPKN
jgi:hypothetical protein